MNPWVILAVAVAFVGNGFYWHINGGRAADIRWTARLEKERADAQAAARAKEHQLQEVYDATTKRQAARLAGVQRTLDAALDSLRDRPERPAGMPEGARSGCAGGSGAELSRADAEFLAREAARADGLRAGVEACYAALDAGR